MGYRHFDIVTAQSPKRAGSVCGDVVMCRRTAEYTLLAVGDGLGSGVKANLAANMCVSRLLELVRCGYTLREAFATLVRTMNDARQTGMPFTAFSLARFLPNGDTTILTYEAPPPVLVSYMAVTTLKQHTFEHDNAVIGEASVSLEPGDAILLVSDGITQAGLGAGLPLGWGNRGLCHFVRDQVLAGTPLSELPGLVHDQARQYWAQAGGDDCTAALGVCRKGEVVTLFTGPPVNKNDDYAAAREFCQADGVKAVCGATTAQIVARYLGKELRVPQESLDTIAPPHYTIDGIDLVTEGAVTLNQVYNILDADPDSYEPNSGVSKLSELLRRADRVNFFIGRAANTAAEDISYRQQGILPRETIVRLLAKKLEDDGKLVVARFA